MMKRHFVLFLSPGTFVSEVTEKPIDSWDVDKAVRMSLEIDERHSAVPFGFTFITKERGLLDLDSRIVAQSGIYYLGGRVETLADVEARNDPNEEILRSNMRINGIDRIVINDNSWRSTKPLNDGDVVLDIDYKALRSQL